MIKNNLISLAIHFIICLVTINIYGKTIYEKTNSIRIYTVSCVILTLFIMALYILVGYVIDNQGSILKNFLSVSSIAIILIISISINGFLKLYDNDYNFIINYSFYPLISIFEKYFKNSKMIWMTLPSLIPTLLLWVGLMMKQVNNFSKARQL